MRAFILVNKKLSVFAIDLLKSDRKYGKVGIIFNYLSL